MREGECDVCRLAYGDKTPKTTGFCKLCNAWICEACKNNWTSRAIAALKRGLTDER